VYASAICLFVDCIGPFQHKYGYIRDEIVLVYSVVTGWEFEARSVAVFLFTCHRGAGGSGRCQSQGC